MHTSGIAARGRRGCARGATGRVFCVLAVPIVVGVTVCEQGWPGSPRGGCVRETVNCTLGRLEYISRANEWYQWDRSDGLCGPQRGDGRSGLRGGLCWPSRRGWDRVESELVVER